MAVVTTLGLVDFAERRQPQPNEAPGITELPHYDESYPFRNPVAQGDSGYVAAVTNNLPIDVEPKAAVSSWRMPTFLDDYYYRIHIRPGVIDLGNLLSSQTRQVEVWNAHFVGKLLSSITDVGLDGIDLAEPAPAPTTFKALESRIYVLSISTNGAPVIDLSLIHI